jgi:RNA polymerase sigma-70 factor (ECF subfamily)
MSRTAPAKRHFQNSKGLCSLSNDEHELIESCLSGNRDAQQQLYLRYCEKVYRLMYRMVGESNADDLTQHIFLCLFAKLDQFAALSSFSTWLYRLASNEALQFLRRRRQREPDQAMPADLTDHRSSETTQTDHRNLLEYVMNQLDPELRAIFLLRESEGLSYYDIAMALDIAEGTVASRLNRARRSLRKLIEEASN